MSTTLGTEVKPDGYIVDDMLAKEKSDGYRVDEEDVSLEQRQMESQIMYVLLSPNTTRQLTQTGER